MDLSVSLGSLRLKNPILAAAGTFGYGLEFQEFFELSLLGGIITKTLTLEPRPGNPAPRLIETPSGMLNAVGLQNVGIHEFLKTKWPELKALGLPVILSIAGFSLDEFVQLATLASVDGVSAIELNLSCPNVEHGPGARCFAQSESDTQATIRAVRNVTSKPVIAKLTPEVTDIGAIAKAAVAGGADILSVINTMSAMAIDSETERPILSNVTGGLSGPAMHPIALRCVWEVRKAVSVPIIGVGGVISGREALNFILAGANAVAVGTASFWNPRAPALVVEEFTKLVKRKGRPLDALCGAAHKPS